MVNNLDYLQKMTGENDITLLKILLDDAEEFVLSQTRRTKLIPELNKPVRDIALVAYNRRGTEGEKSRSEAGESYSFEDISPKTLSTINKYRLAVIGGVVYEAKDE